jgi:hypothetical protein
MTTTQDSAQDSVMTKHIYKILSAAAIGLILLGTVSYRLFEDWSWVDSLYFSVIAVTTVGFGDLAPSTDGSKLFTILYILGGISIFAAYLDARMKRRGVRIAEHRT